MSSPFLGEIKIFAGNFAPRNWAFCEGQLLAIASNNALFSLLGTIYGGDGRTTFGLPDLRGRVPLHQGTGLGLTPRTIGSAGGSEAVSLTAAHLPAHTHAWQGTNAPATETQPGGNVVAGNAAVDAYRDAPVPPGTFAPASIANAGNAAASGHENRQPYIALHYIIALAGVFPSRS